MVFIITNTLDINNIKNIDHEKKWLFVSSKKEF